MAPKAKGKTAKVKEVSWIFLWFLYKEIHEKLLFV